MPVSELLPAFYHHLLLAGREGAALSPTPRVRISAQKTPQHPSGVNFAPLLEQGWRQLLPDTPSSRGAAGTAARSHGASWQGHQTLCARKDSCDSWHLAMCRKNTALEQPEGPASFISISIRGQSFTFIQDILHRGEAQGFPKPKAVPGCCL